MTTGEMQIYSIEVGDVLVINEELYTVIDTDYADEGDDLHVLTLVDEEGNRKSLKAPGRKEMKIIINEYV
jgi:hypothetical protein